MSDKSDTEGEGDTTMIDDDVLHEQSTLNGDKKMTDRELDEQYPNRPHNHSKTLPFSDLFLTLFNPLQQTKQKRGAAANNARAKTPLAKRQDDKKAILERFVARWRKNVGNDIYPAFRLIMPDRDRDRAMYGLKEMAIAKLLVKLLNIGKDSDDANNILHWKLPGMQTSVVMAGDFAGRCYEVIKKRESRSKPGDMTIAEVNDKLDELTKLPPNADSKKEDRQLAILREFYQRMNAEELKWLIRMILRQMKIGATEKTILERWHPDAENLFNISSSLKRVCWELYDPQVRLEGDSKGIHLMHCFQPQLAGFQMRSMETSIKKMKPEGDDNVYWIEEKLDGERMQMHMERNEKYPGGFRFQFWSRKGKDYNDLYGEHLEDKSGAMTKHLKDAFQRGVQSLILDGEMITWNMEQDKICPFGTLKTAASHEQRTQHSSDGGMRPLYRIFDCLFLNGKDLTNHTLRIRREALEKVVNPIHRRFEIHEYTEATEASEVEPRLREVVAENSEGLVLKNPRSAYRLNDRNDDWIKVKPEYMTEFGEALDCVVIGGYYGSGRRGQGNLSSFLCGLRYDDEKLREGDHPQKCYSFFKVGGGFTAADYAEIRHRTDGKWKTFNSDQPPDNLIYLGGGKLQFEKPDVYILPEDSFVLEVKAASIHTTTQFGTGATLRFPRFKKIRSDKTWKEALSTQGFYELKKAVEEEREEKKFKVDDARKKRSTRKKKRELVIQGQEDAGRATTPFAAAPVEVFKGLTFHIMTDALKPLKKSKAEIEAFVKANGGTVVASDAGEGTICIADRNLVKVASLVKRGGKSIVRPRWLWDQVAQSEKDQELDVDVLLLPVEMDRHAYYATEEDEAKWFKSFDQHGDSYFRDLGTDELKKLLDNMPDNVGSEAKAREALDELIGNGQDKLGRGLMFYGLTAYFETEDAAALRTFEFAGGKVADSVDGDDVTHVVMAGGSDRIDEIRRSLSRKSRMPRLVTPEWIGECWKEEDRVDEEAYAP